MDRRVVVSQSRILAAAMALLTLASHGSAQFVEEYVPRLVLTGEAAGDQFGWLTKRIGDVDGDGGDDFVVTAPTHGGDARGRIYVYSGRSGTELYRVTGAAGEQLGFSISPTDDVDGDGWPDLLVGAPAAGRGVAYSISGATGNRIQRLSGEAAADAFGDSVAGIDDLDGDGIGDLLVTAPQHDTAGSGAGRAYLYSGVSGALLHTLDGDAAGDTFGGGAGRLSDLDGDGLGEFVVSAPSAGAAGRGRAYVYSSIDCSRIATLAGDSGTRNLGRFFVSDAGDVDADGTSDIYVADFAHAGKGSGTGKVFVFSGATFQSILEIEGAVAGEGIGPGRGAGDFDGDGHADLIVGAWTSSAGAAAGGAIFVYSGSDGRVLRSYTGSIVGDALGFDAASTLDVDGDGARELLLAGTWNDAAGSNAGRVYVAPGSPQLLAPDPGVAGAVNTFPGIGAVPAARVVHVFGFTAGTTRIPNCDLELDLAWPFFLFFPTAGDDQKFETRGFVPSGLSGTTLFVQAAELGRCVVGERFDWVIP